jgi:DNA-damage-inducible protein D
MKNDIAIFEEHHIRRFYDESTETWYFSVVDIIQVLIQQPDYQTSRNY